jgi:hypothetical protein
MLHHNVLRALLNAPTNTAAVAEAILNGNARPELFDILVRDAMPEEGVELMTIFKEGNKVFIRTLSDYWVGEVVDSTPTEVHLKDAAWVSETGLLMDFCKNGRAEGLEVEPVGEIYVAVAMIAAAQVWKHELFLDRV